MKDAVVIIGIGQMGGVFARGFLKLGHPVVPVLREMSMERVSEHIQTPPLVLVAVAEGDLAPVLQQMPERWKGRMGLLQNELLPGDWQEYGVVNPTVIAAWFEKKFRRSLTPLIPSPIYGPNAKLLAEALTTLDVPVEILASSDELVAALVMKNLFILTANIAGLVGSSTVGGLLEREFELTQNVFRDVIKLQEALADESFDQDAMWEKLVMIFRSVPGHGSRGRSAPQRLERALKQADSFGFELTTLRKISQEFEKP